jgi:putative effector of murein hydrolase
MPRIPLLALCITGYGLELAAVGEYGFAVRQLWCFCPPSATTDAVARGLSIGIAVLGLGTAAFVKSTKNGMALTASATTVVVSIPFFDALLGW